MGELNDRQKRFVAEYCKDFNASQAAIRAGYKGKPNSVGPRLLANVGIQEEIRKFNEKAAEESLVTVEYIIKGLKEVADRCTQGVEKLDKLGHPTGIWEFDSAGANKSFELLGKYKSIFTEKVDVTSKGDRIVWVRSDTYPGKPK